MDLNKVLSELATQCLLIAIPILVPALFALIAAKVREAWKKAKDYAPDVTFVLEQAAQMAVTAAEQFSKTDQFKITYESKKEYALDIAKKYLETNKIEIDPGLIEAAIESAVMTYFNKDK